MKLNLLLGKPVKLSNIGYVYPYTLNEISDMGKDVYNKYLYNLIFNVGDLDDEVFKEVSPFEILKVSCIEDEEYRIFILKAFGCFLKEEVHFYDKGGLFYLGGILEKRYITNEVFDELINILKIQNCRTEKKQPKMSKKRKEIMDKIEKLRKKYKQKDDGVLLDDIISSVSSKHPSVNLLNIGDLTIYQVVDKFKRLNLIENCQMSFDAMLHSVNSKSVKVKHWADKID